MALLSNPNYNLDIFYGRESDKKEEVNFYRTTQNNKQEVNSSVISSKSESLDSSNSEKKLTEIKQLIFNN